MPNLVPLPPNFLEVLHEIATDELVIPAGTPFVSEGQDGRQVFLVRSGQGLRANLLQDGRRQVVSFLFPGDIIGLQALLIGQFLNSAEARSDMGVSVIERRDLRALWRERFEAVVLSLQAMAYEEVRLTKAMVAIGQFSAEEAVASLLHTLFSRARTHGMLRGTSMAFPFRQADLADALGLSLVHMNKTIAKLRRAGHLELVDGRLSLQDADRLARTYNLDVT
ncbi:Crp/Fnr family transcriptional regulator [Frigidibacter sp. SD6-1]|uniref:Crp/Fnr family transcriptional regulator n=1 Tax=Frigidibacter sp. SD6-1 TaxID=3032581 RepID=UPI0024DF7287|nr:Crp/Fnr family transcriptional regulator [Frigidibacter sp. SD6-1]